jgi:hypothetical protein
MQGTDEGDGMDLKGRGRFLSRLATGHLRALPDFVMIGGMKCGTTSLFQYLQQHPGVSPVYVEEVHYFDLNYGRGLNWYRAHFPMRPGGGEATVSGDDSPYYIFHPMVPARVAKDLPDVKLIALLRNPVDRAYSHYNHELRRDRETLSFEQALDKEAERLEGEEERMAVDPSYVSFEHQRHSYVARGRYAEQLDRWFALFPRERILVLQSEEMFRDPGPVYNRVLDFLDLPASDVPEFGVFNPGGYKEMEGSTRRRLEETFEPLNEDLFKLLGRSFDW